jgi:CheY-like chemotaxis protein
MLSQPGHLEGVPRRVLVAEDDPDGRESLSLLLSLLGHQVEVAGDGPEAVHKALGPFHPDVAIIDIGLPKLDGIRVGRLLRDALGPGLVLVAHTAYGDQATARLVAEAGYDAHLVKPVDVENLLHWLEPGASEAPGQTAEGDGETEEVVPGELDGRGSKGADELRR